MFPGHVERDEGPGLIAITDLALHDLVERELSVNTSAISGCVRDTTRLRNFTFIGKNCGLTSSQVSAGTSQS